MRVLSDGRAAPDELRGGAVALGNFDGVHLGHQAVIGSAVRWAKGRGVAALVATFDPHPSRLFRPDAPPFQLTSLPQRLERFAELGADGAVVIPFTPELAALSAEGFVEQWLVGRLAPAHVVTGQDFSFGHRRSGDVGLLRRLGERQGFSTTVVPPVADGDGPISSTRIRQLLVEGRPEAAARLMGRPFAIEGAVVPGDRRGRTIGVPTANMELGNYLRPRFGVYAVRVRLPNGRRALGVANLGIRPMFEPPRLLLETWILDWEGDLYGQRIEVELIAFLRDEQRLPDLKALQAQVLRDAAAARRVLAQVSTQSS
ncbi:MAG: bifunctional riboflavin kinase/FAD synthetase [Sphingomonadaceae bacterium]|uniref:bifunctional riboflavin kinase/FAD synthetase n=1 Tax=Thermaurantiacus sp. TaxID=2820283 RepID=UPI00298F2A3C|nr:bifunctional riboflavin kinase/FAD synthetase [Thermaurantiacus sp.]MCS6987723.1 bifunctional riboflavin kinase/FAD synthetase [Sphingomonadaceae bacterium]MDW8415057.1 bifunctional riboflavin kinase/FAD synthetase [Thermaurantiacus sp.]